MLARLRSRRRRSSAQDDAPTAESIGTAAVVQSSSTEKSPAAWGMQGDKRRKSPRRQRIDYRDTDDRDESSLSDSRANVGTSTPGGLRSSAGDEDCRTADENPDEDDDESPEGSALGGQHPPLARMKAMLVAYTILLLLGFSLSLLSDLSRIIPPLLKFSIGLQVASSIFFCLMVPLTHFSGRLFHRKWKFYQPFIGGTR